MGLEQVLTERHEELKAPDLVFRVRVGVRVRVRVGVRVRVLGLVLELEALDRTLAPSLAVKCVRVEETQSNRVGAWVVVGAVEAVQERCGGAMGRWEVVRIVDGGGGGGSRLV